MNKILQKLRGGFGVVGAAVLLFFSVVFLFIFRRNGGWAVRNISAKGLLRLFGVKVKYIGEFDPSAKMLILNHESMLDVVAMEATSPKNLAWIAKKQLFDVPWYGNIFKLSKMISIDREDKKGLMALLRDVKDRLDAGRTLTIFPEGTRSDGDKLLPFKPGPKIIARKYNLIVQPIVVINSRRLLDSSKLHCKPGELKIIFLDVIDPEKDPEWFDGIRDIMQSRIDSERAVPA